MTGARTVVTGEAVPLDIRVARLGSRVLALLLDLIIQVFLFVGLMMMFAAFVTWLVGIGVGEVPLLSAFSIVSMVATFLGYPVLTMVLTRGSTLGKLALGLRVVRDDGGPVGFRHALTRSLVGFAVEFPGLALPVGGWVLSIMLMTTHPMSKRLADHAAGTFVIHERDLEGWGWIPAMPPGLAVWASTLDLSRLDDELALAVRHFLARNRQLREPARTRLGQQLAREVAAVTSPPPPAGTPGWAYLAAVHAERHARAMRQLAVARQRSAAVWPDLLPGAAPAAPGQGVVPAGPGQGVVPAAPGRGVVPAAPAPGRPG